MIYASSNECWILQHNPSTDGIDSWVTTGGRPLGITFDQESNLLLEDAFLGLLSISTNQTVTTLANRVNGSPIKYANVDIASDGKIYSATYLPNSGSSNSVALTKLLC